VRGFFHSLPTVTDAQPNPDSGVVGDCPGVLAEGVMNIRATRIAIGAAVFVMGILSGAGVAMWVLPPV
jgi:hypothetical protein